MTQDHTVETIGTASFLEKSRRNFGKSEPPTRRWFGTVDFYDVMDFVQSATKMPYALLVKGKDSRGQDCIHYNANRIFTSGFLGNVIFSDVGDFPSTDQTQCQCCRHPIGESRVECSIIVRLAVELKIQPRDYAFIYFSRPNGSLKFDYQGLDPWDARKKLAHWVHDEMREALYIL